MSANATSLYAQQYANNIQLKLQQKASRLRQCVTIGNYVGEQASPVDQVDAVEMQPVTAQFAPITRTDAAVDRRWIVPSFYDLAQQVDTFDKLKMLTDLNGAHTQNAVSAAGRQFDRLIIAAAIGTAKTGKTGTTSTTLPNAQKIAVNFGASSDVGLTVAKLREAKRLLMKADVDLETDSLWMPLGADQHDNLLAEAQVISLDFNEKPVLMEGRLTRFLGINFIHTELAVANLVSGDATIPVWARSGMHLGIWTDVKTDVSQRKDLSGHPWQSYVYMGAGATRLEEEKVVQIACNV